ncbi:MAG: LacI family DNA-binding transcriptional regulator [Bifidobacterium scardovii]|uniref:LacI family DNA-binding transcriptional regulator n=1 Tax=Bifidobacterium scardovii TaxID=158787 RepID=UPI000665778C|nr:LacI family DNA-binding transcriptional regulator [Bifidobacterium scardovii]MBS6947298.1 LacI family DNA-binding transcriptional regulator [Bifidobacterium scardovii]MDU3735908.1 LacI family DNA-binding transcriptional regulator [Bifidobacterium scardovii]MDU5296387.1 LacI family DNA-binding transcriptional regulator [Bifidobacterium scardovii]MDU5610954.1 LacI family DNA-binding transcriptional regulator [Bifidobacterium scardovii]MDU5886277.1 LacI family DNA-binding transcriptional regul
MTDAQPGAASAHSAGNGKSRKGPAKTAGANIRDIAAAAGVSVATVSRVMRGNAKVSDETRAKVEQAVKDLGYVPNAHALALTTPPNSVTLVMRSITGGTYSEMAGAVADEAIRRGMTFRLIATGGARVDGKAVLTDLLAQRPRVAIIVADDDPGSIKDAELNEYVGQFESMGTTLVALARPRIDLADRIGVVDYANERGVYMMTKYLISLGHRDMLFVGVRTASPIFTQRYQGFLKALADAGIDHDPAGDLPFDGNRAADAANVVARYRDGSPFTAVVGVTDVAALDSINALQSLGVAVPGQISAGGFDDMPYAGDLIVPLTTVHVPFAQMGATAVRIGLGNLKDVMMPAELVVRKSTGPVN